MGRAAANKIHLSAAVVAAIQSQGLGQLFSIPAKHRGPLDLLPKNCPIASLRRLVASLKQDGSKRLQRVIGSLEAYLEQQRKTLDVPIRREPGCFESALAAYVLFHSEKRRVYRRGEGGVLLQYVLTGVSWLNPQTRLRGEIELAYRSPIGLQEESVSFRQDRIADRPISEALGIFGLMVETPELELEAQAQLDRFREIACDMGGAYEVTGFTAGAFDCALQKLEVDLYHTRSEERYAAGHAVIVDRLLERRTVPKLSSEWVEITGDDVADVEGLFDLTRRWDDSPFWREQGNPLHTVSAAKLGKLPGLEVPLRPLVSVYDTHWRERRSCHVAFMQKSAIDKIAARKIPLVIDRELLDVLDKVLLYRSGQTHDLVMNKTGGAVCLFNGAPGSGKTLTAEVCSRRVGKPLYAVQCSELGLDPTNVEHRLRVVFDRAERWGAIVLLDEADLYVSRRGSDLQHSGIVDAFLRVLEYQDAVMFMTTNMTAEAIDPAVRSRCLIRYDFQSPNYDQRLELWRIFAKNYGVQFASGSLEELAQRDTLLGRDIRNIVRLVSLVITDSKPVSHARVAALEKFRA